MGGIREIYHHSAKWIGLLSGLAFVIVVGMSEDLLRIFGDEFVVGGTALRVFALGQLIHCAFGPTGSMLLMFDKTRLLVANAVFMTILSMLMSILLIPAYGLLGAASAASITFALTDSLVLGEVIHFLKLAPGSLLLYLKRVVIILLGSGITYSSMRIMPDASHLLRLIVGSMATLVSFALLIYWIEGIDGEERAMLSIAIDKFLRRGAIGL